MLLLDRRMQSVPGSGGHCSSPVSLAGSHGNRPMPLLDFFVDDLSAWSISTMGTDARRL
jgi:hypothetical protein